MSDCSNSGTQYVLLRITKLFTLNTTENPSFNLFPPVGFSKAKASNDYTGLLITTNAPIL